MCPTSIKMLQLHSVFFRDAFYKPVKVKGNGSCLYQAVASHIMSCCLNNFWTDRFPPGKKPRIKLAIFEVVNDLKQFISQKDNALLQNLDIYGDQDVNDFIKEKREEWNFSMALTEMNEEHFCFGDDFYL